MNNLLAQAVQKPQTVGTDKIATLKGLEAIFANVVAIAIGATAIVLFIFLLRGGLSYITSGGSPEKTAQAKNVITYAIYGVIFVAVAYLILFAISQITGVTGLLNFTITQ